MNWMRSLEPFIRHNYGYNQAFNGGTQYAVFVYVFGKCESLAPIRLHKYVRLNTRNHWRLLSIVRKYSLKYVNHTSNNVMNNQSFFQCNIDFHFIFYLYSHLHSH